MPDVDYVISVRSVAKDTFDDNVGPTRFLRVPPDATPAPSHAGPAGPWYSEVQTAGSWQNDAKEDRGDILIMVHGYNSNVGDVIDRHRRIKNGLADLGFKGVVVSYDWPSGSDALAYLPDRHRAKLTAFRLVSDAISVLSKRQKPDCPINIHLLGHSTGAYVIREAFDDADDTQLANSAWTVSQLILAAGDISSGSMSAGDHGASSVYNHCVRLTNYSNRHDSVLDLSNVKRVGVAPRVGRIGLPPDAPSKAVNVDCTNYYAQLDTRPEIATADEPRGRPGAPSHSWYFGNAIFTRDLFATVIGTDRQSAPTRSVGSDGTIELIRP